MRAVPSVTWQRLGEGEAGILTTLRYMRWLVDRGLTDPRIVLTARDLVAEAGRGVSGQLATIFQWLQGHYTFVRDPTTYELVIPPDQMLVKIATEGRVQEDCESAAVLLATLVEAVGIPTRFRVLETGPQGPSTSTLDRLWGHVFVEAWTGGAWVSLDLTLDPPGRPGDRPPHAGREAVFTDRLIVDREGSGMYMRTARRNGMGASPSFYGIGEDVAPTAADYEAPVTPPPDLVIPDLIIDGPVWPGDPNAPNPVIAESGDVAAAGGTVWPGAPRVPDFFPLPGTYRIPATSGGTMTPGAPAPIAAPWWTSVVTGVTRAVEGALPLLERYGALKPQVGPARLPLPGEPRGAWYARTPMLVGGKVQTPFGAVPQWLLVAGAAGLVWWFFLRR